MVNVCHDYPLHSLPRLTARGYSSSTPRFKDLQSVTIYSAAAVLSAVISAAAYLLLSESNIWINLTNP